MPGRGDASARGGAREEFCLGRVRAPGNGRISSADNRKSLCRRRGIPIPQGQPLRPAAGGGERDSRNSGHVWLDLEPGWPKALDHAFVRGRGAHGATFKARRSTLLTAGGQPDCSSDIVTSPVGWWAGYRGGRRPDRRRRRGNPWAYNGGLPERLGGLDFAEIQRPGTTRATADATGPTNLSRLRAVCCFEGAP